MQLELIQLSNVCAKTKSPIWMKIAGSPSPGTPGEVTRLGSVASIMVKSPASRTHGGQEPYLDPQTYWELLAQQGAPVGNPKYFNRGIKNHNRACPVKPCLSGFNPRTHVKKPGMVMGACNPRDKGSQADPWASLASQTTVNSKPMRDLVSNTVGSISEE